MLYENGKKESRVTEICSTLENIWKEFLGKMNKSLPHKYDLAERLHTFLWIDKNF